MSIKTTAINKYNVAVQKQSGRVGTVRYIQRMGETYVRAASNSKVTNSRTDAQMTQRMKFASLAALYSVLGSNLKGAYQTKQSNQTDFNAFMQVNQGTGVFFTKDEVALGYSEAMPVIVASGKLGEVSTSISGQKAVSNIALGSLTISASTKISDLAAAIIANNDDFDKGEQLTIVQLTQDGNRAKALYKRIILDVSDDTLLSAIGTFTVENGCLAFTFAGEEVCIGYIHSAGEKMSYCKLVATETMLTAIAALQTDEVYSAAKASYGTAEARYLNGSTSGSTGSSSTSGSSDDSASGPFTISLSASPANGGTVTGAGSYEKNATATIKAEATSGYHFNQWSDGNTSATRTLTVTADKSLTAIFVPNSEDGE